MKNPLIVLLLLLGCAFADERPNILLIMADDLGFSDVGCYGGEIETPNLDKLAANGLRFTNFYNASRCCPTRASMLTGLYPHQAWVGRMTKGAGGGEGSAPGYKGELGEDVVTIAEVLKTAGYQTGMVGKWHLSPTVSHPKDHMAWLNNQIDKALQPSDASTYPVARGFEKYYGNIWGVVDFFDPFSLVEGNKPVLEVPEDYYITDALNDKTVDYIQDFAKADKPFFLYLAHCAPHWPLHALPEDIEKYKDTYKNGWQAIREARYQRQIDMGLIDPKTAKLSDRIDGPGWGEEPNQEWEAMHMSAHAAMIDRMDQGLGRVIAKLQELGELDNTLILFLSDNGASPERPNRPGFDRTGETRDGEYVLYAKEMLEAGVFPGPETTYSGIGRDWANVANTPFRFWKKEEYQGGVTTPLIVHWPKGIQQKPGSITTEAGHIIDIMATCVEVAEAKYPERFAGQKIQPMEGKSLIPVLKKGKREGHEAIYFEHFGARGMRQGDWKIVALKGKPWELYNLAKDFTEMTNLAEKQSERVQQMAAQWEEWANRARVYPTPAEFDAQQKATGAKKATETQKPTKGGPKKAQLDSPAKGKASEAVTLKPRQGQVLQGAAAPQIERRPITVSATIDSPKDGVVVSHGGWVVGYSLHVKDQKAIFTVRQSQDEVTEAVSKELPAKGPIHLMAELRESGQMTLFVNGLPTAQAKASALLPGTPGDGLAVGDDPASNVGNYNDDMAFGGTISNVVINLGAQAPPAPIKPIGDMKTRWAKEVGEVPLPDYPRPQLVRGSPKGLNWQNLNGKWDYAIRPKADAEPEKWDGKILVPFAIESQLSGVQQGVGVNERLWYHREFEQSKPKGDERVMLHFGAVDWDATVYVNGKKAGQHKGGYDPFRFDITDLLVDGKKQKLVVSVWDPTDTEAQARGKQVSDPRGIWYTAVTGIWQTVWTETVPGTHIESVKVQSDIEAGSFSFDVDVAGATPHHELQISVAPSLSMTDSKAELWDAGSFPSISWSATGSLNRPVTVKAESSQAKPQLWSPETPNIYAVEIALRNTRDGSITDRVKTYAALRKIHLAKDENGHQRLYLNNKAVFHYGPLDQGWWPDGLYTAPTDEALLFDIVKTKEMGFNTIRKHVKVEPARWYYHCDREGLLVWQDMPTGFVRAEKDIQHIAADAKNDWARPKASAEQFEAELTEMVLDFEFFPCIVMWDLHNEGWGQYETDRVTKFLRDLDPSRLVNAVSGWTDRNNGDVRDLHHYPGPGMEPLEQNQGRAVVLGEFGGLGWPVADHLWWDKRNWGYRTYTSREELHQHYEALMANLYPMIDRGLAAAIYTQTTDVEGEVNGLMTYDRDVIKIDPKTLSKWHAPLYRKPGQITWLARDGEVKPQAWKHSFAKPVDGWETADFDDAEWQAAKAPFNSGELQYLGKGTAWPDKNKQLWLRREFTIEGEVPGGLSLKVYCDGTATIYVNGEPLTKIEELRIRRHYDEINLSDMSGLLKKGKNILAVKVEKPQGPRGFDMGLYGYKAVKP